MDSHQAADARFSDSAVPDQDSPLRRAWRSWGDMLRQRHLDGMAALLLDAGRPLALVSAQFLYMSQPLLGKGAGLLARLLESESETTAFLADLAPRAGQGSTHSRGAS